MERDEVESTSIHAALKSDTVLSASREQSTKPIDRHIHLIALFSLVAILTIYAPTLSDTVRLWLSNDNYGHGFLIIPCSLLLLWMQRGGLRKAQIDSNLAGLPILLIGLIIQVLGYTLQVKYIGMWSLIATCAGATLLLYGNEIWRIARFPVAFLLFAAPFSGTLLGHVTGFLQGLSAVCAESMMKSLGFIVERHGNVLSVPGASLEIADACSGFHKLISMLAFASLFGYLATPNIFRRLLLIIVSVPIAIAANIARIGLLVAATANGGMHAFHALHEPSDMLAIIVSFLLLVSLARRLGCGDLQNLSHFSLR